MKLFSKEIFIERSCIWLLGWFQFRRSVFSLKSPLFEFLIRHFKTLLNFFQPNSPSESVFASYQSLTFSSFKLSYDNTDSQYNVFIENELYPIIEFSFDFSKFLPPINLFGNRSCKEKAAPHLYIEFFEPYMYICSQFVGIYPLLFFEPGSIFL